MSPDERLLTVGAVARELQVSAGTIRNWIKAGDLPAQRMFGGWFRIRVADLHVLRERQKTQNTQDAQRDTSHHSRFPPH